MDSLFSSTLDTVAPLRLRKIKRKWRLNGEQLEKNKIRGILYCLVGKYSLLQESLKNC